MCELTDKLRSYNPTSGYSRVMREAADKIDELWSSMEWRPIETAPKDGSSIMAVVDGKITTAYWSADGWIWVLSVIPWICDALDGMVSPTHWMPLPNGPDLIQD